MTSISKSKTVTPLSDCPPGYMGNVLITIDYPNGLQTPVQSKLCQLLQTLQGVSQPHARCQGGGGARGFDGTLILAPM